MPHSSPGFGEIAIDRIYVIEKELAKETNEKKMSLAGQESSPPTTVALCTFIHGQISAMEQGKLVPVVFRDKTERDAYYTVDNTGSELTDYQGEVATADWTIELIRAGSDSEVDIQSRLSGATRNNDFSLTGERWHAPAIGHYAYYTGTTSPSAVTRTTDDSTSVTVYRNIPTGAQPKWGCPVAMYKNGRVRVTDNKWVNTENEIEGINQSLSVTGWGMTNGLVNVTPTSSAGVFTIGIYDGSAYQNTNWKVQVDGTNITAIKSVTLLRNDFEQCIVRTVINTAGGIGRHTLDLTLRRGSYFVEGYLQTSASGTLKVSTVNATTASSATPGTVTATTASSNIKPTCGSARTFTADLTNCGLSKAATTTLDFWLSATIGSGSGSTGATATNLRDQYIGCLAEITYAVRR